VTTRQNKVHTPFGQAAVRLFVANDRMNQIIIEHLDPIAWKAKPPGKVRTIAAIFTHMHNVRAKWVRLTAPHLKVPRLLKRTDCTPQQARADWPRAPLAAGRCLRKRWAVVAASTSFVETAGLRLGRLARKMLCYMLSHEAHHRGQVCMLAHQMGFPLPNKVAYGIWNWERLGKSAGA